LEDSGIESLEDLKGKKIGVPIGTTAHSMILKQLDSVGLTEEDVELVNLSFADCVTSLTSGDIDVAVSFTSFVLPANKDGANIKTIADATGLGISNVVLAASGEFTEKYPEETANLLKAFDDATQWIADNKDEAISYISEIAEQDEELTTVNWEKWKQHVQLTDEDIDAIQGIIEFAKDHELIENEVSIDDLVDTSYLEAAGLQ
jgi:sulfonate transport system substrate-binding protein